MDMRQSDVESHQSITVLQMTRTKKPRKTVMMWWFTKAIVNN